MSDKSTTLPLPAAIDAAYLLLIGQLCLNLSKLIFGIIFVVENNIDLNTSPKSILLWILGIFVALMLFINIISCWKSTRSTFDELGHYPNNLLTADILIIVCFFFLNTVVATPISFMEKISLDAKNINEYLSKISVLWETIIPLLFFTTAFLVISYRFWNKSYALELKNSINEDEKKTQAILQLEQFNFVYLFFFFLFILFGFAQLILDYFFVSVSFLTIWLCFWLYVNFFWVIKSPTETR